MPGASPAPGTHGLVTTTGARDAERKAKQRAEWGAWQASHWWGVDRRLTQSRERFENSRGGFGSCGGRLWQRERKKTQIQSQYLTLRLTRRGLGKYQEH